MATTYSAQKAEDEKKYNQMYDKQIEQVNLNTDANIKELTTAYDDEQRAIAVQKLVNERKVAESMANLGLTDSGLNRTQQTAVQLSAANAGYNLNRQKQAAIDKYELDRSNQLAEIEQNRLATDIELDNYYNQLETSANAVQSNNAITSDYSILADGATVRKDLVGSFSANGISVIENGDGTKTYIDTKSGHKTTLLSTVNPYTGENNVKVSGQSNSITALSGDEYDYFKNGYQPKGVYGYGAFDKNEKGTAVKSAGTYEWSKEDGRPKQNVFSITKNGKVTFWVWDGRNNEYFQVKNKTDSNGLTYWEEV